jgi:hypothetical protein
MKAFIVRTLLILVSLVLLVQLWIFGSLVWWRTHPVESTMMMRLDYWSEPSNRLNTNGVITTKSVIMSNMLLLPRKMASFYNTKVLIGKACKML